MRYVRVGSGFLAVALMVMVQGVSAKADGWQQTTTGQGPIGAAPNPSLTTNGTLDPAREKLQEQAAMTLAEQRHKRMITDADKLLQLATELKEDVDKSTKNEMSVTAVKKAAEIEKLAHDVKERMKGSE
jgi:hypothetical protein